MQTFTGGETTPQNLHISLVLCLPSRWFSRRQELPPSVTYQQGATEPAEFQMLQPEDWTVPSHEDMMDRLQ
jgi:hypothetical protein